jgi:hypothetical protein
VNISVLEAHTDVVDLLLGCWICDHSLEYELDVTFEPEFVQTVCAELELPVLQVELGELSAVSNKDVGVDNKQAAKESDIVLYSLGEERVFADFIFNVNPVGEVKTMVQNDFLDRLLRSCFKKGLLVGELEVDELVELVDGVCFGWRV